MKKLSYLEVSIQALEAINSPATYREVWEYIEKNELYKKLKSYDEKIGIASIGKTPQDSIAAHLYAEAKKDDGKIHAEGNRPKRFLLKSVDYRENQIAVSAEEKFGRKNYQFHERDIHPLLCSFLYGNSIFNAYSRTIFHEQSNRRAKGADKWLYPDMVAVNFEYADYKKNLHGLISKFYKLPLRIFSFEIKIRLDFSNYKEYFFQAVSNSSWANEGYLVALLIDEDESFIEALQKLSNSFGIGVIHLDAKNIPQSTIVSPARYRENIDYTTVYELAEKNKSFDGFLKTITEYDPGNKNRFIEEFDKIMSDGDIDEYVKKKNFYKN